MASVTMSIEEYQALLEAAAHSLPQDGRPSAAPIKENAPVKRKPSAYNRRYAKAFKKVAPRFKKKSGGWMKNGFKRAQREAHRIAGRGR